MPQLVVDSPVGPLLLVADDGALTHVWFDGARRAEPHEVADDTVRVAATQLGEYFAGDRHDFDVPLRPRGRDLQICIWSELQTVPWGTTVTYGQLADRVGMPAGSARVVGAAMGGNPLPVIVPCHRVIGADGLLTGYGGGLDRKVTLLRVEGVPTERDQLSLFD